MSKPKPCPVCGSAFSGGMRGHAEWCFPALRALVRTALRWQETESPWVTRSPVDEQHYRAVARFRKEQEEARHG